MTITRDKEWTIRLERTFVADITVLAIDEATAFAMGEAEADEPGALDWSETGCEVTSVEKGDAR